MALRNKQTQKIVRQTLKRILAVGQQKHLTPNSHQRVEEVIETFVYLRNSFRLDSGVFINPPDAN